MKFMQPSLLPWILVGATLFVTFVVMRERGFYGWVKEHWFMRRRWTSIVGSAATIGGFLLLAVVLMDPREGEIKIKGKVRQDKTILLIDTSSSMLAEDVRPSRLEKAVLLAKHFVRKAAGHQIAVMVFADITKKLVPFTTDLDLLDARIDSVRALRNMHAGSSIGLAIEEAVRHFDPSDEGVSGNIVVFTDGEDNADTASFKVPKGVSLVLVGIGTASGAPIPMKDSNGINFGNKKERGITIVTKLNKDFFKAATEGQDNAKFFLAQSFDLPTDEIMRFIEKRKASEKEGDNLVRPVALERWAIPALILLSLGFIFKMPRPFAFTFILLLGAAQGAEKPEISSEAKQRLEELRDGKLDRKERINLADRLIKEGQHELAEQIYEENLRTEDLPGAANSWFNAATLELERKNIPNALSRYEKLDEALAKENPEHPLRKQMRENIRRALLAEAQSKKQKKDEGDKGEKKDKDSSGKGDQQQKSSEGEDKQGKPGQEDQDKKNDKNPFDPKNKDDQGDKEEKKDKGKDEKDSGEKPSESDESKKDEQKKAPRPKVSPLLEQLKQDDRKLQLKLLDTSTQKRHPGRKKDW